MASTWTRGRRIAEVLAVLVLSIGLDQWTKRIAQDTLRGAAPRSYLGDVFRFHYAENHGAFLSMGAGLPDTLRYAVFTVLVGGVLLVLVGVALFRGGLTRGQVVGYALVAGGGLSNWVDRAWRGGAVVDFMNMGIGSLRTGIFNVADLFVLAGLAVIVLVRGEPGPGPAAPPPPANS